MKTPAYRPFMKEVGKTVHHLNTIVVGLSGVETGACTKPTSLDISWSPVDLKASSRDARLYTLKSTIVFMAEELSAYTLKIIGSPTIGEVVLPKDPKMYQRHEALCNHLKLPAEHLLLGPLLIIHWRNRIVHKKSNAKLTNTQKTTFLKFEEDVAKKYKNLSVSDLLAHFERNQPTLKDVSSLVAMTINLVGTIESLVPEPATEEEVVSWLKHIDLYDDLERIKWVAASKPNPIQTINNFFMTNCPELKEPYEFYCKK
ncbi:MAG: hypothetical protein ACYCZH_06920 [Sulfuriferula sp.]